MVEALEVENVKTGEMRTLPVNGVFMYIGQIPNTAWLKGVVELDESGYIVTDELLRTSCQACSPAATPTSTRSSRSPWPSARARWRPCRRRSTWTSSSARRTPGAPARTRAGRTLTRPGGRRAAAPA